MYAVRRTGERVVLEGMSDLDPQGNVVGDARGERIVLVQRAPDTRAVRRSHLRGQATREIQEYCTTCRS